MTLTPSALHVVGTALFALALVHTFSTAYFERLIDALVPDAEILTLANYIAQYGR